ncbi:hypothetical protein BpHYR1_054374 [Brachionus plicatilis]|uniref:Uncharacterized protein n=1 Tax=Brachionus plicatilis TaxID=10195 RepID=A0A3M7PD27_BRAPC|nr:hypothetical protein BpHYR1_054374 [Brachionus plicatilis]
MFSDIAKISPNISKIKSISTIAQFQCIFKIKFNQNINSIKNMNRVFWERLELQNFPFDIQELGLIIASKLSNEDVKRLFKIVRMSDRPFLINSNIVHITPISKDEILDYPKILQPLLVFPSIQNVPITEYPRYRLFCLQVSHSNGFMARNNWIELDRRTSKNFDNGNIF